MPRKAPLTPLAGPRVRLRPLTAEDLPTTLRWRNREEIRTRFVHSDVLSWEQHRAWFEKYEEKDDDYLFVIELPGPPVRSIGQIGLYHINRAAGEAEFGRILIGEDDVAGRGFAREATEIVLQLAFGIWKLQAVDLEVYEDNHRAIRLYERCGFVRIGGENGLQRMRVGADNSRTAQSARFGGAGGIGSTMTHEAYS